VGRLRPIAAIAIALAAAAACTRNSGGDGSSDARRLAADLIVQFTKAADASNRAVMAENDNRSDIFAREAERALAAVEKDVDALAPLLRDRRYATEGALLDTFRGQLGEYRTVDRTVLAMAIENTNVKAQQLSFGAARHAADDCRSALEALQAPARDQWQVTALAVRAYASVREIQAIQAPHIAEPDDAAMDRMEQQMAAAETAARQAIADLGPLVAPSARSRLSDAKAAFERFIAINQQIVVLSRRNTNVRSLALSLNEKAKLTAACEATLGQLRDALAKRDSGLPPGSSKAIPHPRFAQQIRSRTVTLRPSIPAWAATVMRFRTSSGTSQASSGRRFLHWREDARGLNRRRGRRPLERMQPPDRAGAFGRSALPCRRSAGAVHEEC
jgi:hypothetical protein